MMFEAGIFYGFLVQGDLRKAIAYIRQFPSEVARLARYEKYQPGPSKPG